MIARLLISLICVAILSAGLVDSCHAQDTVYVSSGETGVIGYSGEVVSYTGERLVLKLSNGTERTFPGNTNIVRIDTQHTAEFREAQVHYDSGEYEQALESYERALQKESRAWVQRMILEQIIYCEQSLDHWESAARRFLILVSSDPKTPYFPCIPLAWVSDPPLASLERQARTWLESQQPVSQLLGASHLLATQRADAERVLSDLRFHADQRVAALARMQLWRTDLHRADVSRIAGWEKDLERSSHALRAGGYFLIGSANVQIRRAEAAALSLMRVPIHYPRQRRLVARCLIESGRQLEVLGQTGEATRLYQELVDQFAAFPESAEARSRLDKLAAGQEN